MGFKCWLESHGPETLYLRRYLRDRVIDLANYFWEFKHWRGADDVLDRLRIGWKELEEEHEEGGEQFYELMARIEGAMSDREKDDFVSYMAQESPGETPTWAYMSEPRLVRPDTWLVHFSDQAWDISRKGFRYGMDDMTRLGLTTYYSQGAKKYGGYNFAFVAGSRYASAAARTGKYGKEAVMFRAGGVRAYHYGDDEEQVVFWGKTVSPNAVVHLTKDGGEWGVQMTDRGRREVAFRGSFDDAEAWVVRNWTQYRRVLAGYGQRSEL